MKRKAQESPKHQSRKINENPKQVLLPFRELILGELQESVVRIGLHAVEQVLREERDELCGPRYQHGLERKVARAGTCRGELSLGGRRISVRRPRVRTQSNHEVQLPSWEQFSAEDPLNRRMLEQMLIGVSTRKYSRSLESLPTDVNERSTSKSTVSRRFIDVTEENMKQWQERSLYALHLVAMMIDAIHIGDHVMMVALGIDQSGLKHILGVHEGATEHSTPCIALLTDLRDRGLSTDKPLLFVLDGGKALDKAVRTVFGCNALIQRCQVHKKRNVLEHLPIQMQAHVSRALSQAYRSKTAKTAKQQLLNLHKMLKDKHPGAAASLLEGLDNTLTVLHLGLRGELLRFFSATNAIENLMGLIRFQCRNVRRWKDGKMIERWTVTALLEAQKSFRRVRGFRELPTLVQALAQHSKSTNNNSMDELTQAA